MKKATKGVMFHNSHQNMFLTYYPAGAYNLFNQMPYPILQLKEIITLLIKK